MPSITQIKSNAQKFKKVEHRPWDEDGLNSPADHISVNSNSVIFLSDLFIITMSGLWSVVNISAGIVPPFIECPGISVYIVKDSGFPLSISFFMYFKTESCLQLKRFWLSAVLHQFNTCSRLPKLHFINCTECWEF